MTYRGQVKNGVVVLEGNPPEEGTIVRVEPIEKSPESLPRGSAQVILHAVRSGAHWQGDAAEVDRLLAELKEMKRMEVAREMDAEQDQEL